MTTIFKRYFYYWKCLINTWCLLYLVLCRPAIILSLEKKINILQPMFQNEKSQNAQIIFNHSSFFSFFFFFQHLRDKFWNFLFYKFIFIFGVMNVQTLEEVVSWVAWFTILGFFTLLTQLSKDRFEYVSG